jgi:hypothetical protein
MDQINRRGCSAEDGNRLERMMKSILAASPAVLLAGAMLAAPASAQTMAQPDMNGPAAQPYASQLQAQPYAGQAMPQQQTVQGTLPQGPYLTECKQVRMLQDTLTAFCPRGDGTWQTTQLVNASSCPGGVHNAGGDLVCATPSQFGSTTAPENYSSSYGGTSGTPPAPPASYGAFGTGPQPTATSTYVPPPPPVPSQSYAAPTYNGNGGYTYNPYNGYPPAPNAYVSPSPTRAAQPPY